jgi:1-acyl-sn-glycerol-3-phosphate acyltransferase
LTERPHFLTSAARFIVSGVNSLGHFVPLLIVSPFSRPAAWAVYMHWAQTACRIFGITLSKQDDNNGDLGPRPHLYVWLNQSSLAEVVTLRMLPPVHKVANLEYALMPLVGWTCVLLRDIVIVRQWKNQAKKGPVVMAIGAQATIIPMVINGGYEVMPRGEWRIRPGHIELRLLKSIPTRGLTYDDPNVIHEHLHQVAERALQRDASVKWVIG